MESKQVKYRDKFTGLYILKKLLFLVSIFLLIPLIWNSYEILDFKINGLKTVGLVTDLKKIPNSGGDLWKNKIEYIVDNKKYECKMLFNSGFNPIHFPNEKVVVLYMKNNPSESKLNTIGEIYLVPVVIISLTFAFFIAGFLIHKYPDKTLELMNNN